MTIPIPSPTPNVVVQNPTVRKAVNIVLGVAALALPIVAIIDAGVDAFDVSQFTNITTAITLFVAGAFGLGVTLPNIPANVPKETVLIVPEDNETPHIH
jgi:hypothetical protein